MTTMNGKQSDSYLDASVLRWWQQFLWNLWTIIPIVTKSRLWRCLCIVEYLLWLTISIERILSVFWWLDWRILIQIYYLRHYDWKWSCNRHSIWIWHIVRHGNQLSIWHLDGHSFGDFNDIRWQCMLTDDETRESTPCKFLINHRWCSSTEWTRCARVLIVKYLFGRIIAAFHQITCEQQQQPNCTRHRRQLHNKVHIELFDCVFCRERNILFVWTLLRSRNYFCFQTQLFRSRCAATLYHNDC